MDIQNIELRYLSFDDYQQLKEAMIEAYPTMPDDYWRKGQINKLIKKFPEGQVVVMVNDQIAGCALSIIVDYDRFEDGHTYNEVTGNYTFNTHNDNGDVLYVNDVFI